MKTLATTMQTLIDRSKTQITAPLSLFHPAPSHFSQVHSQIKKMKLIFLTALAQAKEITNALYFGSFVTEQKHGFERVLKSLHVPTVQLKNGRENTLIYSMLLHRIKARIFAQVL